MEELKDIIESLLFVSDEPLSLERIKSVIGFAETTDIRDALQALSEEYDRRGGGFSLRVVAGGYQLRTRPEHKEYIKRLVRSTPPRLSRAALETLAIVAYYKPITRTDIEHIRGVDCGGVLRLLLERKLIRVLGRKEVPGRPMIYETTKRFLEVFDLKDIRDLPTINEIESLGRASAEHASQLLEEGIAESVQEPVDAQGEESDGENGLREDVDPNADEATDPEDAGQGAEPTGPSSHPQSADNPPDEGQHV